MKIEELLASTCLIISSCSSLIAGGRAELKFTQQIQL